MVDTNNKTLMLTLAFENELENKVKLLFELEIEKKMKIAYSLYNNDTNLTKKNTKYNK